jgi:dTDP-4-dehydrorhamnose reductase
VTRGEEHKIRLALVGANGMLAGAVRSLAPENYDLVLLDLPDFDLTDKDRVLSVMNQLRPDVIVNCAAYTNVDGCETNEETALLVNGSGPGYLAEAAKKLDATLVHVSTDYVFDGTKNSPYTEEDVTNPQSAYGRSKLLGEKTILESGLEKFFIVRTSWLYGPGGKNFVETIARLAKEREELRIVDDQVGSPTFTDDLARAIFNLLALDTPHASRLTPHGLYHFADEGECSWYEFAETIVAHLLEAETPLKMKRILPIATHEYPLPATRPAYSVFSKDKYRKVTGAKIPDWKTSLVTYLRSFRTQIKADARR